MIYDFSYFFSNQMKAFLHCNEEKKQISDILKDLDIKSQKIAIPEQVHSKYTKFIKRNGIIKNKDGLVTQNQKLILSIKVADCVPIFLQDPKNNTFGLVHSGWRGTVGNIIKDAINKMEVAQSNIKDIKVFLGPSIKPCCYEVDSDVAKKFSRFSKIKSSENKWMIDLHKEIKSNLLKLGILESNIECSEICTYDQLNCHSFRRSGDSAGRMIAFMGNI
tara:strand:+ start:637 stop:1293 length:657 start_codon:yes stop_codon:yes gene_type:complete